jgi:hypothetical protein
MSTFETDIDGLRVILSGAVDLKKASKLSLGVVCEFPCECGLSSVKVEKDDIIEAGRHHSRSGAAMSGGFDMVKLSYERSLDYQAIYNKFEQKKLDFVGFYREKFKVDGKWRARGELERSSAYEGSLSVSCEACGRERKLQLRIENPIEAPSLPSPLEVFRSLGFGGSKENMRLLARVAFRSGFQSHEAYINYLRSLDLDAEWVKNVVNGLLEKIKKFPEPNSEKTRAWLDALKDSLRELVHDFQRENTETLSRYLNELISWIKPPLL